MSKRITRRPRNVDAVHASGVLYGDLGTSKIYVVGLAFAVAGYASFWLIAAVSILTLLIGINYIIVCKYYPNGGGVYASLRKRSKVVSLLGAFFLFADYIITAALSALSAFLYLGVPYPLLFTIIAILFIGLFNFWGPRYVGKGAFVIALLAIAVLVILFVFSIPHIPEGWKNLQFMHKGLWGDWTAFVAVILTLSGIESVANMTGVMKLNPGTTEQAPVVTRTASKAIWFATVETAIFTTFFTLVLCSISGLLLQNGNVVTPEGEQIRDYIFRFLGTTLVGEVWGTTVGYYFGLGSSIIFAILLLSAVNTAINGMIALFYIMAQDGEMPRKFTSLNKYGVPKFPHIVATLLPVIILLFVNDMAKLGALYAIGFVGAIAMNLGASATDRSLPVLMKERVLLAVSALIMAAVEVTLFIDKAHARIYVLVIIVVGLILRTLAKEAKERKPAPAIPLPLKKEIKLATFKELEGRGGVLCIVSGRGQALNLVKEKAVHGGQPIAFLFVREQRVMSERDFERQPSTDKAATKLFNYLSDELGEIPALFSYVVSDAPSTTIARLAQNMRVVDLIVEVPRRGVIAHLLRGDVVRDIWKQIPEEIDLIVLPS